MRRRSGAASIAANPILIGAVTTLLVVVAVFLAYNANSGLPFVPTYDLKVEVPDAVGLVKGNDVRIGGTRIGIVADIGTVQHRDGSVTALLDLKLQEAAKPITTDTLVMVRPRSALGLKYVQLTRGTGTREVATGGTLPIAQAKPLPVELDQFFNMFDDKTRAAIQGNLRAYGDAFAGRGQDLNFAIQDLGPFLTELGPVLRNLASTRTDLAGFFRGLGQAARETAPAAQTQSELFTNLDTTFSALADVAKPFLQQSITEGPASLDTATRDFPQLRPFFRNSADLFAALQPGVKALADATPDLDKAARLGIPALRATPALNNRAQTTFKALQTFATDPLVKLGLSDLDTAAKLLEPTISYLAPSQTVCNYLATALRNASSLLSEGGTNGTLQRFSVIASPGSLAKAPNNEGGPSSAPANGPTGAGFDATNYLHSNPYPLTAAPGQPRTCEAGNEKFLAGRVVAGNVPGQPVTTLHEETKP